MKSKIEILEMIQAIQTQMQSINDDIASVKQYADTLTEQPKYDYQFTKEQMIEVLVEFYNGVIGQVADHVHSFDVDEDSVGIEMRTYGNTAEALIDIDQSAIQSAMQDHVEEMYIDKNTADRTQLEIMLHTATEHITK